MKVYIDREIESELNKYLKLPQIIAVIGPRRSGKTTLLLHWQKKLPSALYLTFEDQKVLELFDKDIENFAKIYLAKNKYLFIDEFHYAKRGGKNLKYLFDLFPKNKIIVSGSSAIDLTIRAIKFLVGRVVTLTLLPFSFSEFLRAKDENLFSIHQNLKAKIKTAPTLVISQPLSQRFNDLLKEYLIYGGYPEVVLQANPPIKQKLLNEIYSLYFLKEVRDILGLIDDYKLKSLLTALSLQIGNICQYNELAQLSAFSFSALKKYLNFLEKTYISFLVKPFFTNKRTELAKNPKVYFFDTGLRNAVIDNFIKIDSRNDQGALFENFAAQYLQKKAPLNFWRSKAKAEVDFVIQTGQKIAPIEIKSGLLKPAISPSLSSFLTKYKPRTAFVYSLNYSGYKKIGPTKVYFRPLFLI